MDSRTLFRVIDACRAFLVRKQSILYGKRDVRFDLESHYEDYDGMLKREIVYSRFDVLERLAICRIHTAGAGVRLEMDFEALLAVDSSFGAEELRLFLLRQGYLSQKQGSRHDLTLPHFRGEVVIQERTRGGLSLSTSLWPLLITRLGEASSSLEDEVEDWIRRALAQWSSRIPGIRIEVFRDDTQTQGSRELHLWRRLSRVDIDSSAEENAHVFRWMESSYFASASHADISEAECRKILRENEVDIPNNARYAGASLFDIEEDSECIALRYAHLLPDPTVAAPGAGPEEATYRNQGFIAVEGDFWEFHIDAAKRLLIGEYRKWRDPSL